MHVGEAIVYQITKEDDHMQTHALGDVPHLAQIHVNEDLGEGPEEQAALRVRPLVENLQIGNNEDMSHLAISLTTEGI